MSKTDLKKELTKRVKQLDKDIKAIKGVTMADLHQINNLSNKRASVKSRIENIKPYQPDNGYRHYTIDRRLI